MTPRWLKTRDACRYAGVCRNTLNRMLRDGILAGSQINARGDWRVDRESIDAFMARDDQKALAILAGKRSELHRWCVVYAVKQTERPEKSHATAR